MARQLATWTPPRLSPWQRFRREPAASIARWLHSRRFPLPPIAAADSSKTINIVCISDTHQTKPELPDGDLLLHAGDLTNEGSFEELQAQLDWLASLPHRHKIIIAGNHDRLLDPEYMEKFPWRSDGASRSDLNWHDLIYLNNSCKTIEFANGRKLSIFGSPWTPEVGSFAFQYPPIRDIWTNTVPDGTDVLLTHGPPKGYLDMEGKGCPNLTREIARKRPRLVVFGHIHGGHGREEVDYGGVARGYQKVMTCDGGLAVALGMVFWLMVSWAETLLTSILRHRGSTKGTRTTMINAAIGGLRDEERHSPTVLEI